jgi:hypothetical protein
MDLGDGRAGQARLMGHAAGPGQRPWSQREPALSASGSPSVMCQSVAPLPVIVRVSINADLRAFTVASKRQKGHHGL